MRFEEGSKINYVSEEIVDVRKGYVEEKYVCQFNGKFWITVEKLSTTTVSFEEAVSDYEWELAKNVKMECTKWVPETSDETECLI